MEPAYIIAEAGVNHGGDPATALEMVRQLAGTGADAIKFQVYNPEKLVLPDATAYWHGTDVFQQEAFAKYEGLGILDYAQLSDLAHSFGLDMIVTPFHTEDVSWLTPLVDRFKIASGDITHTELLNAVGESGKPVILSTGASTMPEIRDALALLPENTRVLHCTLCYPTQAADVNLSAFKDLKRLTLDDYGDGDFENLGYSDHTIGAESHGVICAAYQLGATTIEKHYTLDRRQPGNDHNHSFQPDDFRDLRIMLNAIYAAQGAGGKRVLDCELTAREGARRSLTSIVDIPAGTTITRDMIAYMRPGTGLQP